MKLWVVFCCVVGFATWVGGAHAQLIEGTSSGDVLVGTDKGDRIYGYGGNDTVTAKNGPDYVEGGSGADTLDQGCGYDEPHGGYGEDLIYVDCQDGKPDVVYCGADEDIVFWRVAGTVLVDCENVYRVTSTLDKGNYK